jgi:PPOX class probable F420-dependent enzyme
MPSSIPQSHQALLDAPNTAFITTTNPDGSLHNTAVWFLERSGNVEFSVTTERKKCRNLVDRPQVGFSLLDPATPWRWISIAGIASVEPDDDRSFMAEIGAKYQQDVSGYDKPGAVRVKVSITPTQVLFQ